MYDLGLGCEPDHEFANDYYIRSISAGDARSYATLGLNHELGRGVVTEVLR